MIVVLSFDTFGDITLRQPLFRALLDTGEPVTVVVRRGYERLLPFLDARLKAVVTDVDPYVPPDETTWSEIERLGETLAALEPRIAVAAPYNRTYLDEWLLARLRNAEKVGFVHRAQPDSLLDLVLGGGGKAPRFEEVLSRGVEAALDLPEVEKNRILLREISGCEVDPYVPTLALPDQVVREGAELVRELDLEPGRYVLGCTSSAGSTPLKVWPPEPYVEVVAHLHEKHRLPVLVTGVESASAAVDAVVAGALARGIRVAQWIGGPEDLGRLFGVIRHSRLFVGNDGGPMHFAAALGIPVAALFGGGHWPRFLPRARRSFIATQKVPCFGCNWICWLEEPVCVTRVEVERFKKGIDWILSGDDAEQRIDLGRPIDALADEIIRSARSRTERRIEALEADRAARLKSIHQLTDELRETSDKLRISEGHRSAQVDAIRSLRGSIAQAQARPAELQAELDRVRGESAIRLETIESLAKQLEASESDRAARLEVIRSLERQIVEIRSFKSTVKRLAGILVRKLGLYRPLKSIEAAARRGSGVQTAAGPAAAAAAIPDPAPEPQKTVPQEPPSIHSRLVEAFVRARSMRGGVDERALERFYRLGASSPRVLCLAPTPANVQAMYMLAKGGARLVCLAAAARAAELGAYGIDAQPMALGPWMVASRQTTLLHYDTLLLHASATQGVERLLEGRLWPSTTIFITGDEPGGLREQWGPADEVFGNVAEFRSAPTRWIDPAHASRAVYDAPEWPASGPPVELPPTLPSGRPWPKISVVTVTYNQAAYLEETLRSVLLQGYPNLEYIVLDGKSRDGTPAILERYREQLAHCASEKDQGQSDALNKGFARATGDILAWLNSDDRYLPWTLVRVALAFDVYGADVVAGGCALVQDRQQSPFRTHHNAMPIGEVVHLPLERLLDIEGSWIKGDFFYQPEVFWTRRAWERSGARVSMELFYSMDYELWVRMAQSGATIVHVPDTLAIFRMHAAQKTSGDEIPYLPELLELSARIRAGAGRP